MTVLVTGAAGHVGGHLVRALIAQGRSVRALDVDRKALERLGAEIEGDIEIVQGDVCDPVSLQRAFAGVKVVYHTAGYVSILWNEGSRLNAINVIGTRNIVGACLRCGVRRLVHFSSIHALEQEPLDIPLDESRPLVVSSHYPPYDRSKAAGEREVRRGIDHGLDAIILNPTGIIGPHDCRPSHIGQVILAIARGRLPVLVKGGFDWVDVRDVIEGALRAKDRAPAGARYLLSGHWVSMRDLATMVAEMAGARAPRLVYPLWLARLGAPFVTAYAHLSGKRPFYTSVALRDLQGNRQISHERATRDLDYYPRPFEETISDTLRWFKETGHLTV